MTSNIMRSIAAARPALSSSVLRPATPILRTFASRATPGQSSNATASQASSSQGQGVLNARATDDMKQQDTKSMQTPISNPEEGGLGGQEETTPSQGAMKRDPNEPAEKKREKVLEYGQNKKLDAADEGTGKAT